MSEDAPTAIEKDSGRWHFAEMPNADFAQRVADAFKTGDRKWNVMWVYYEAILVSVERPVDFDAIDAAILAAWTRSGLNTIKRRAWSLAWVCAFRPMEDGWLKADRRSMSPRLRRRAEKRLGENVDG